MAETTQDIIMISSSDDDSDCQIVKVSPLFGGRSKRKMRWQYQPPKSRLRRKWRRQQNEDIDDDQDGEPTSKWDMQHLEADVAAVSADAAGTGDSMADHSSNNEMIKINAKAARSVTTRVDPKDPVANRHDTADLEPLNMPPPPFPSQTTDASNQILPLDDEDMQQVIRSRSCSVATLDFPFEEADAQGYERDVQGISTDMLDEQRQLVLEGATNCITHSQPIANLAVLPNADDGSILALESLAEESNSYAIKIEEPQNVEAESLKLYKKAPTTSRGRLPRVGKRRAWSSIINFAAYEKMLGPLFTRQKERIRSVTYDDVIWERAETGKSKK
ncbi:hypothetical protein ACQKWADRAFT_271532 [Trichoderma austrokoningii]